MVSGATARRADVVAEHTNTIGLAATHDAVQGNAAAKQSVCVKPPVGAGEEGREAAGSGRRRAVHLPRAPSSRYTRVSVIESYDSGPVLSVLHPVQRMCPSETIRSSIWSLLAKLVNQPTTGPMRTCRGQVGLTLMGGRWGAGVFQLPETLLSGEITDKCSCELCVVSAQGARVMSLTDGTTKMSKSDPNDSRQVT